MRAEIVALIEGSFTLAEPTVDEPIRIADHYRELHNSPVGINPRYAVQTLLRGEVERWQLPVDACMLLGIELVNVGRPFTQVVIGNSGPGSLGGTLVTGAWRLYEADEGWRPRDAFAEVLSRYGAEVIVNDRAGRFVAVEYLENADAYRLGVVNPSMGHDYTPSAMLKKSTPGPDVMAWGYVVDDTKYMTEVKSQRG